MIEFSDEPFENFYEVGDEIGSGQFAVVKKCKHIKSQVEYAAKFIRKRRTAASRRGAKLEDIRKEVELLSEINHETIIKLYDVYESRAEVVLVLELVPGGELFDFIAEKEKLSEEEASAFIKQILHGVRHMHDKNIVHLDLKPENVMLTSKQSQKIKLIDFGLSRKLLPDAEIREMMGTPEFVAPEVINYEPLHLNSDMWSIGVITYILLSGASPFLGDDKQETFRNVTAVDFRFDDHLFASTSDLAKDFINKLFVKDPRKRLSVHETLRHPWIQPIEKKQREARKKSHINIDNLKAFTARKRWKQSLRVVSLCNRLSRSMLLRRSGDVCNSTKSIPSVGGAMASPENKTELEAPVSSASAVVNDQEKVEGENVPNFIDDGEDKKLEESDHDVTDENCDEDSNVTDNTNSQFLPSNNHDSNLSCHSA